ncbi:MAG TPA: aminotransferase class V-fold PLP-dependent enzyme [Rudaea sp.]|nr:aminotransferase class V-fold PLP-dependent enzyme [Rudaea sp.]
MSTLPSQRHLFDVPDQVAYFNNAYLAPQLKASLERQLAGVHARSYPWERTAASFFEDAETVRGLCARVLGGDADGYAVVSAASYGVSTAARAIEPQLKPGDAILVIAEEFPSNVLPWKRVAQETGATVVTVPIPADGNWTAAILEHIDRNIRVVAASPSHWTNGARIDLHPIGNACRDIGAMLVVDASQSLGAAPFSIAQIKPDFLVAAAYKWLLCPYGFAVLYVSEQWRNARPLEESWLVRERAEDFANLVRYSDTYMSGARRFDGGEKCSSTILPGAIAALEQVHAWGIENIAATLAVTNATIAGHLQRLGFKVPAESVRSPHMFGAQLPDSYQGNIVAGLRERGIYISQRGNSLRFAPHLHVNAHDVDRLTQALDELVR